MKTMLRLSLRGALFALLAVVPLCAVASENSGFQPAQPISAPAPSYPYLPRRAEAVAEVTVVFTVTAQGAVTRAEVEQTSDRDFNDACLAAIRQWKFTPARKDGRPVETRLRQTFRFSLHDRPQTETPVARSEKKRAG